MSCYCYLWLQAKKKTKNSQKAAVSNKSVATGSNDLAKRIDSVIEESDGTARWGISVVSMADGSKVYERDGDKLFTPASNMKIYTTGVALICLELITAGERLFTRTLNLTQTAVLVVTSYSTDAVRLISWRVARMRIVVRWRNSPTTYMREV